MRCFTHIWEIGHYKNGKLLAPAQRFDIESDAAAFAKRRAVEEIFDATLGKHVRVAIPIHNVSWSERLSELPDGIVIQDQLFQNDGHTSQRVYSMPVEPPPTRGPAVYE